MLSRAWEPDRAGLAPKSSAITLLLFVTPAGWRGKTRVHESVLRLLRRFPHSPDAYRTPDSEDSRCRGSRLGSAHRPRTSCAPLAATVRQSACPGIAGEPPAMAGHAPSRTARTP